MKLLRPVICGVVLTVALVLTGTAAATPPAGYGTGSGYCTSYSGGVTSAYSFENVYACQGTTKGSTTFDTPGNIYAWQCVELSARFLWAIDGIWAGPGSGVQNGADLVSVIGNKYHLPIATPGPGSVPAAGDVISFQSGGDGHTAVVISANSSQGTFQVMSENDPLGQAGQQSGSVDLNGGHNGDVSFQGHWVPANWLALASSGGGGGGGEQDRPSALSRGTGSMDVFYRTSDGHLAEDLWGSNTGWHQQVLPGPANVASDPSAISRYSTSMDVFYRTTDGHLAEDYWGSNTGWNNQTLPGWNNVAGSPSAVARDSGSMDVFYRTTGGNLSEDYWSVAGGWNSTGLTGPANVASDPSAISRYSTSMDVFYRTTDGHLAENYWGSNTGWNNQTLAGWNNVAGDPSAIHRDSGSMDVFYVTTGGNLSEDYWSVAGGWNSTGLTGPANVAGDPSAISRYSTSMDVFYRTTDGHLAEDYWGSNTGWNNQTLPGSNNVVGDPSALTRDSGSMDAFYDGASSGLGDLGEDYWSVAGGWVNQALTVSPSFTLSISRLGSGSGTVNSNPAGIDCGSTCSVSFANGQQVTLTATPSNGSDFAGWSGGGCSGTGDCVVDVNQTTTVAATFDANCVAPDVLRVKLAAAESAIKNAHCSVGKVKRAFSKTVGRGKVITQTPPAGTALSGGSPISLTVSKGPRARRN